MGTIVNTNQISHLDSEFQVLAQVGLWVLLKLWMIRW